MPTTSSPAARGQQLDADNLQAVLDAGTNDAQKGRQQFFTPRLLAEALSLPLPRTRECAVDLTMGAGDLLLAHGAACSLGIDIDSRLARKPALAPGNWDCVAADLTAFYPLLTEIEWQADCFVLNPPFSIQWHKSRLAALAESRTRSVKEAFAAVRGETIESSLATLLIALDRGTEKSEGYLILNENTARRLFTLEPVPDDERQKDGNALHRHFWLWLTIPAGQVFENVRFDFPTAVLYFALGHDGPGPLHVTAPSADPEAVRATLAPFSTQRHLLRRGLSVHQPYDATLNVRRDFQMAATEWRTRQQAEAQTRSRWNLWLQPDGTIGRYLTPFQNHSRKIPKAQAQALDSLHGQRPLSLVVQKATRSALLAAVHSDLWTVQPELIAAVEKAIAGYHANRAPFYRLNEVQRLGYLDEQDRILCKKSGLATFRVGESYALSSSTVTVEREETRMNILGKEEMVRLNGQELALTITAADGKTQHVFRNGQLAAEVPKRPRYFAIEAEEPVKTKPSEALPLETLIEYFHIPEVPDVAEVHPAQFATHLASLRRIEADIASRLPDFTYFPHQLEDYPRAAMHDGCIISHDPGMGKSLAAFTLPLLKGARINLIVAPESLHQQLMDEGLSRFGVTVRPLLSQEAFEKDAELQAIARAVRNGESPSNLHAEPLFWITSYSALGFNGGDQWTPKEDEAGEQIVNSVILRRRQSHPLYRKEQDFGIGEERNGIRCVFAPNLATLVADLFECVICDEAVRLKSNESHTSLGVRTLNARFRYPLTATPIKNHLDDLFWLAKWACGGGAEPTERWPYAGTNAAKEEFANEHMLIERNLSREAEAAERGRPRRIERRTPRICNIHRLWKLLGPVVIRRRKDDLGTAIVPKTIIPIRVNPGRAQNTVYQFHATNAPEFTREGTPMNPIAAVVAQLQNLRQAALCPHSPNLSSAGSSKFTLRRMLEQQRRRTESTGPVNARRTDTATRLAAKAARTPFPAEADTATNLLVKLIEKHGDVDVEKVIEAAPSLRERLEAIIKENQPNLQSARSWTDHTPKQAAILQLTRDLVSQGEQVVIMSPFQAFSDALYSRLRSAGISVCLLDGKISPKKRGAIAKQFKQGHYSVLIGGIKSMGEGHSFECASHLILPSLEWAFDANAQAIDRVHRLTSKKPVSIYCLVTLNTIDLRLESVFREKGDSSQLALDGRLFADKVEEINLGELLRDAIRNFDPAAPTVSEQEIEEEWETLKEKLRLAEQQFREWHPPIVPDLTGYRTTPRELESALAPLVAEGIASPAVKLVKGVPAATFGALLGTTDAGRIDAVRAGLIAFCQSHPQLTDWRQAWRQFEKTLSAPAPAAAPKTAALTAPAVPHPAKQMNPTKQPITRTAAEKARRFLEGL